MSFFNLGKPLHMCSKHNYTGTAKCPDCIKFDYSYEVAIAVVNFYMSNIIARDKKTDKKIKGAYLSLKNNNFTVMDYLKKEGLII